MTLLRFDLARLGALVLFTAIFGVVPYQSHAQSVEGCKFGGVSFPNDQFVQEGDVVTCTSTGTQVRTSVQFGLGYQTSFNSQYRSVYGQVNVRIGF